MQFRIAFTVFMYMFMVFCGKFEKPNVRFGVTVPRAHNT